MSQNPNRVPCRKCQKWRDVREKCPGCGDPPKKDFAKGRDNSRSRDFGKGKDRPRTSEAMVETAEWDEREQISEYSEESDHVEAGYYATDEDEQADF